MSNENNPNDARARRGSVTSAAFSNLFQRSSSNAATAAYPNPPAAAERRRMSVAGLGLSGTSPTAATPGFAARRASMSTTGSDAIDENAVDEDDAVPAGGAVPSTPYARRLSSGAQAMLAMRQGGTSPSGNPNDQGFSWSEQFRSRAESSVTGARPAFAAAAAMNMTGTSPPRPAAASASAAASARARASSDLPPPPPQAKPRPPQQRKPDHFQERILKGDFYMD